MACKKGNTNSVYLARLAVRNCEGEYVQVCCLDNVNLNFENTERVRQQTQDGCVVKDVRKLTASISYDFYSVNDATLLEVMFPHGTLTQVAGALVSGATQVLAEGTYSTSNTEDKLYLIENRNANNTAVTVASVVGSVDGTLVSGTDYEIVTQELCLADGSKYVSSFIKILAHGGFTNTLTTDAQDLTITYSYTPKAEYQFSVQTGSYASTTLDIRLLAVNKQDSTDLLEVEATGSFELSGSILSFTDPDAELNAISATLVIEEDTELSIKGLKVGSACGTTCA